MKFFTCISMIITMNNDLQPTTGYRSPLDFPFFFLSRALVFQITPATFQISSLHLNLGRLKFLGYDCRVFVFYLLRYLLTTCSVNFHFNCLILTMMSKTRLLIHVIFSVSSSYVKQTSLHTLLCCL